MEEMAERGQNTRIIIGPASVNVTLLKTSKKPKEAQHETRRVGAAPAAKVAHNRHPEADPTAIEFPEVADSILEDNQVVVPVADTKIERGVTGPDGWVNLTESLENIDARTQIDGMTIECTIPLSHLPRTWMRDAYFVAPTNPEGSLFLAHLWHGLMPTTSAALVRWTKKTSQYLGAIIARGQATGNPTLVLVELEWAANMRPAPERAKLEVNRVPESGKEKAREAMLALRESATVVHTLRDERNAQRAELLHAARTGQQWDAPEPARSEAADALGDALISAVR